MNNELWEKCVEFHGHECPGLAIGYKVSEAVKNKLNLKFSKDEEIVCVTENDACCVDAVQFITGCSMGKGNLVYRGTGKMAFSFFKRKTGENLRIVLKPFKGDMDRKERMNYILNADIDDLFEFKKPNFQLPEKARLFNSVVCEVCGETAPEHKMRLMDGKKVCLDCFQDYNRGF
ncbi:FmdE family protein [Haloimpatiens sp. FM7330]|uniref:FmdE family protein n=1 Tax=Haloimpatiens sp. FM7330 TaxID=3298610 RepID=UPI0036397C35